MSVPQFVPPWGWAQEMLGLSWPQGDEDALRRCGTAWQEACDSLLGAAGYGNDVVSKVNSAITSVSCDEFNNYWSKYVKGNGILEQLAGQCAAMANYADAAALQIEATKISENVVAVILYIQIIEALAEIAASFGLDTPLVAVQMAAERWAAQSALRMLIKGLIEALAFTLLPDLISETVQMVEGHRGWGDYDGSLLLHDLEHGILLGGLFALPGLGGQLAKRFDLAMPAFAKPLLDNSFTNNPFVRKGAGMVYGGVSMVGGNAATYYADQGIQGLGAKGWADGEQGPFANWQKSFLQGMFQSGIHGAKDLAVDRITTPRLTIDTTGGDNLLVHRYGGAIDPNGASGLTVYRTGPDPSKPPALVGRGSFDGDTGTLTVSDKNGVTTDYQAVRAQTLDRGGSPTGSVTYAPSEGGGAYEPTGVVSHGGGNGPLPAGTSELYDVNGQHQGTAVRNAPTPTSAADPTPVYDPRMRPVDPGASHVFQQGKDPVVVVSGDGQTVPAGFNRPLGTNEAAVYDYNTGRLQEVHTYPGDNPIPPGHQAVFNADGSFQGVQPLNDFLRPQGATGDMAAAHTRAASGIGQEQPTTATASVRTSGNATAVPGDITQDATFHGQNDLEQYQQQYAAEHQQAAQALSEQAQRFEAQLGGSTKPETDQTLTALAEAQIQRELVGAGAAQAAATATVGGRAHDLAGFGGDSRGDNSAGNRGGRSDLGGGGRGSGGPGDSNPADSNPADRLAHAVEPTHRVDPALSDDHRPADPFDLPAQSDWARRIYDSARRNPLDVQAIAQHLAPVPRENGGTGYSHVELMQVRAHLFVEARGLGDGRVTAVDENPEIAAAWQRLSTGRSEPHDLTLLDHSLAVSKYLQDHPGASYDEAHREANKTADWESVRTRVGGLRGDPGVLREGGRGSADDPLPLGRQPGRSGPGAGHREGDRAPAAGRDAADHPADGGRGQDPSAPAGHRGVAGAGHDGELTAPGAPDRPAHIASVTAEGDHLLLTVTDGERSTQARLDVTESGLVVSTLDANGDILRRMASAIDPAAHPGEGPGPAFTIFAHSDADGIVVDGMHLPFSELADHLAGVPKDVPIRLYGCEAADGAAELARVSGHDVIAADAPVWMDHRGTVVATAHQVDGPNGPRPELVDDATGTGHLTGDGTWKLAHPTADGRVETRDLPPGDPLRPPSAHFDPTGEVLKLAGDKQPAPWGFKQLRRIDREGSLRESTGFEQKLGAFDFKDPAVLDRLRSTLRDLRTALRALNDKLPEESQTAFEQRIDSVFRSGDARNAGNVGLHVSVDTILEQGDVRETMTALYNAFYLNYDRPEVFKNAIIRVADAGDWNRLQDAGVNVDSLRQRYRQLNSPLRRALGAFEAGSLGEKILGAGGHRFDRDPVATGNVILNSDHPIENQLAAIRSQKGRDDRPDAEQRELANTAQHYADLGAPLGRLSRDFLQQHMDLPIDDPSAKLPWREGVTVHDTRSAWTDATEEAGLPTADGISLTTTKMLTAAELLGLDPAQREQFLKGLMAWMLPGRDHSLYEMALGAQIARSGPLAGGRIGDAVDPVEFYRRVLDWHGESGPAPDVPLPHQAHYQHLATDPAGFTEARHNRADEPELNELVHEVWRQLSDGHITDGEPPPGPLPEHAPPAAHIPEYTLHAWAVRNGIDPNDPEAVRAAVAGLSEAHLTALAVYTTHSHTAINHALTMDSFTGSLPDAVSDKLLRTEFGHTARVSVERYLSALADGENPGRLPISLRPIVHTGPEPLNKNSPLTPQARSWVDGTSDERAYAWAGIKEQVNERLPALFDEIRVHTDMFMEALHQLPAMGSPEHPMLVFRGDKVNLLSRGRYGDQATTRQVFSLSPDLATAVHFMETNPGSGTPTLVLYELTGKNARDLSPFTVYRGTREYVFPPGARTRRVTDPERIAAILAQVDGLPEGCEIIVMEEG